MAAIEDKQERKLEELLEDWEHQLENRALEVRDEFNAEMYASRNGPPKEWFRYCLRVRAPHAEARNPARKTASKTVGVDWNRWEWRKLPDGTAKYEAKHVRKGASSHRYSTKGFRPSSERERNLIEEAEDQCADIRRQISTIGSIRKVIANKRRARKKTQGGVE